MIGLDLDSKNYFRLLKAYFNSSSIARVEIASTKHGFHLQIRKQIGMMKSLQIRQALGDCRGRLEFDELKVRAGLFEMVDTLFEYKKSENGKWTKEERVENVLASPFWEDRFGKQKQWLKWQRKHPEVN